MHLVSEMISVVSVVPCLYKAVKPIYTKHEMRSAFSNADDFLVPG